MECAKSKYKQMTFVGCCRSIRCILGLSNMILPLLLSVALWCLFSEYQNMHELQAKTLVGSLTKRPTAGGIVPHTLVNATSRDKDTSSYSPFISELSETRRTACQFHDEFGPNEVTYVALGRAGSTTMLHKLQSQFKRRQHHNHECTLFDLESMGARRVIVVLRHPLARISSGVSRRLEGKILHKPGNRIFVENFSEANEYIAALSNESHPKHSAAKTATLGIKNQSFMTPVWDFYLANSSGLAEIGYICLDSFQQDFYTLMQRWGFNVTTKAIPQTNKSNQTSSDASHVLSRFSNASADWVVKTYAKDVALYAKHCPQGYKSYAHLQ